MQNDIDIDNNNAPNVGVDDVVAGASTNEILDEGNTTTGGTGNYNGEVVDELRRSIQNLANGILPGRQSALVSLDKGVLDSIHGLDSKIIRARRPIEIKSENFKLKYNGDYGKYNDWVKQAKDVARRYSKVGYLILENFIEVKVTPYGVRMKQLESAEDVVKHILQNDDSHNERADLDLTQICGDYWYFRIHHK